MRFVRSLAVIMMFSVFLPCLTYTGEAFALGDKSPPPPPPLPQPPPPPPPPEEPNACDTATDTINYAYSGLGATLMGISNQMQSVVSVYESVVSANEGDDDYSYDEASNDLSDLRLEMTTAAADAYSDAHDALAGCDDPDRRAELQESIESLRAIFDHQEGIYHDSARDQLLQLAEAYGDGPFANDDESEDGPETPGAPAPPNNNVMDADQTIGDCTSGACIPN